MSTLPAASSAVLRMAFQLPASTPLQYAPYSGGIPSSSGCIASHLLSAGSWHFSVLVQTLTQRLTDWMILDWNPALLYSLAAPGHTT